MTPAEREAKQLLVEAARQGVVLRLGGKTGLVAESLARVDRTACCELIRPHRAKLIAFLSGRTYSLEELLEITEVKL